MVSRIGLFSIAIAACTQPRPPSLTEPTPVQPTPARTTSDSIVASVLNRVAVHGLPDFRPRRTVVIQDDSGLVSSSSLPSLDSVEFLLLDSAGVHQLAHKLGNVNAISVSRPIISNDTARSGAASRVVWRRESIGRLVSMSACAYRLRRASGHWVIDSAFVCIIS